MKKILFILFLLPALASSQTVVVTGQLQTYGLSGAGTKGDVVIKQVLRSGYLLPIVEYSPPVSNTGVFRFSLPATVGTDTTKAKIYINTPQWRGANGEGVWVPIPHGATVALSSLTPTTYIPSTYPVVVPLITLSDSATGLSVVTDTIRLGTGLKLIAATNGGDNPTIIGTATGGGGGSDSVKTLYDIVAAKADADSVQIIISDTADVLIRRNPDLIDFKPRPVAPTHTEGYVFYDTTSHALTYYNDESDVSINIGRENMVRARNNTGATITNGQAVYISGAIGQIPTIDLAQASDTTKHCIIGIATHDIEKNTIGYITTHGTVNGLNTSAYGDGTAVYLSVDSAGLFTLNKPIFPNPVVRIGVVEYSHNSLGKLLVSITHEPDTTGQNNAAIITNLESRDKVLTDVLGGKGDSDSLSTTTGTANAALPLANLDDSLSVALTNGARSVSSTGRIFVTDDSVSLTVAPDETINAALGNTFRATLPQNDTLSISNMQDGQVLQFVLTNANNFTLSWSGIAWPGGTQPTATAVANKRTIYSFVKAGGVIYGVSVLNF